MESLEIGHKGRIKCFSSLEFSVMSSTCILLVIIALEVSKVVTEATYRTYLCKIDDRSMHV